MSLGTGSYSVITAPKHGTLAYSEAVAPLPPPTCNSAALPADFVYYTWTDNNTTATSDVFELHYQANAGATENLIISVVLNSPPQFTPQKHPIIFIPGIAGSVLTLVDPVNPANNQELWPGLTANHYLLSLRPGDSPSPFIEATDAVRGVTALGITINNGYKPVYDLLSALGYQEYKLPGDPVFTACDLSQKSSDPTQNPSLFTFPYDWRKDNARAAQALAGYVSCVEQFYPGQKVNILAHSMGGLVARRYILDGGAPQVNALITVASPWLGAPKVANVLQTGDFGVSPLAFDSTIQYLAPSFVGAHELLPSQAYFDLGGMPMREFGWDFNLNGNSNETYTGAEYEKAMDMHYALSCPTPFCPGTTGFDFHAYSSAGNQQDNWTSDSTGVQYFHIVGVRGSLITNLAADTIKQVIPTTWTTCTTPATSTLACGTKQYFDLSWGAGDETVPVLSASRETPDGSASYDAPGAIVSTTSIGTADHLSQLGLASEQTSLAAYLTTADQTSGTPSTGAAAPSARVVHAGTGLLAISAETTVASATTPNGAQFLTIAQPINYVKINGADSVSVSDATGDSSGAAPTGTFPIPVPGVSVHPVGARITYLTLPVGVSLTIHLTTTTEPLAIDFRRGTDTTTTAAIRYVDVSVAAGTAGEIVITPSAVGSLRLDTKGDGSFATTIAPTVNLSGSAAADVTPPTITFTAANRTLTIAAQDAGSGVKDLYYSLDGAGYTPYTAPVAVATTASIVYAFADDKAGNRGAAIYSFSAPCDVSKDSLVNVSDIQGIINQALGIASAAADPNGDGAVNVADVQIVLNAAFGLGCAVH